MSSAPSVASTVRTTNLGVPVFRHLYRNGSSQVFNSRNLPFHLAPIALSPTSTILKQSVSGRDLRAKSTAGVEYGIEVPAEIQHLLTSEEMEILERNEIPDLSKISTRKWNPLHTCALSGQIKIMDGLLKYGLHIDSADKDEYSVLHKAVMGKKEVVISHLLRKGANPHVKDRNGATPLHYAVQVGAIQTVKLLIKYNVDVNVADNDGWTPLHIAIQCRSRDIAKILLINGADKTRRNKDGTSPLDIALCFGRDFKSYELAKLLKLVNRDP